MNLPARTGNDRERRHVELTAFLALNPGASSAQLDEIIGHGRRAEPSHRYSTISRVFTWLGLDELGEPYLPKPGRQDEYRLQPAVRTDWDDFRELAAQDLRLIHQTKHSSQTPLPSCVGAPSQASCRVHMTGQRKLRSR